jgi:hypothetical protein
MPAAKKHPSVRARSNRASTAKTITTGTGAKRVVPKLPPHPTDGWHVETVRWWNELWSSALPDSWEAFDQSTLFTLALCFNDIWIAQSPTARKEALGEYRLQRKDFFIAPYNRLQGEIVFEEADAAKDRGAARRQRQAKPQPTAANDPRNALRAVN